MRGGHIALTSQDARFVNDEQLGGLRQRFNLLIQSAFMSCSFFLMD